MSTIAVAVALAVGASGCNNSVSAVPHVDFSGSTAYAVAEFRDDAKTNATITEADMPLCFVDCQGEPIDLKQFRGKKKVVLIVLRGMPQSPAGAFCPSCLAQTSSVMANQKEFAARGAEVLLVFPGPNERLGEFLQKAKRLTPGEPARAFHVLLDCECATCDALGIRDDLAKPSTYILDTHGRLVFAYVGATSTDRPSLKAIYRELDQAQ